jgi:hypothetical protein
VAFAGLDPAVHVFLFLLSMLEPACDAMRHGGFPRAADFAVECRRLSPTIGV